MAASYSNPASVYNFDSSELDIEYNAVDLSNENKNTKRKTETDMRIFSAYLISLKEMRKAEDIPPQELDPYLSMFFSVVKKHDGHEYEPASLRGMLCSVERYLRMKGYQCSITRDAAFNNTRNTLKNKQRVLRENGKGYKKLIACDGPEPLGPSTLEKLNHLYAAKELGPYSPMSVINSICFAFVLNFKMRKAIDHKQLLWGDIVLKSSPTGECLCYEPLESKEYIRPKLKGIEDCRVWSNSISGPNKDPILIYKLYSQKRPAQMMSPESPFYLGVSTSHPVHNQPWYKSLPMGVNKLNDLVRMIRDITGIQKAQTYSNPGSPDEATRSYTVSPCTRSFDIQDEAKKMDIGASDGSKVIHGSFNPRRFETIVSSFNPLVTAYRDAVQPHIIDGAAVFDHSERERDKTNGRSATSDVGLNGAEISDIAVDGRHIEKAGQTDDVGLSIDEVKTLIRSLVEKVDPAKREELVEWMNNLQLNNAQNQILDSRQQRRHYQIIFDLNTNDLNKRHDLELSGRLKLVGESVGDKTTYGPNDEPTDSYTSTGTQNNLNNAPSYLVGDNTPGNTATETSCHDAVECDLNDTSDTQGTEGREQTSSSPLKRSVSERSATTSDDYVANKRRKFGRSFSWQESSIGREPSSMSISGATDTEPSKQDNGDENHEYTFNNAYNEEVHTDDVNLNSPTVSAQINQETDLQLHRQMFAPRWIPPQIFQQFAFHSLAPYANPRWLQLYRHNAELPSMESVFRQPLDTNLLRRVYANAASAPVTNCAQVPQFENYQVVSTRCDKSADSVQYDQAVDMNTERSETEDIPISQSVYM